MDSGISLKAPLGVVPTETARPIVDAPHAAPTEVPQAKAVAPAAEVSPARNDRLQASDQTREVVLDPETRAVIFRILDSSSRQVKRQVPAEALLKLRAYTRAQQQKERPGDPQADVTT